ncbi:tyrosine-type recombinase/integrase [Rubrobacter aplysinae]|uniref:tyrosine-type recombinase/integrase n=1 Tax=Rubrobacter aplysinae TaxID=909625 RepID=UPI00069D202C|nr:tyrosine-type recombinase/integrase [Rubrobacter aplysinae]
MSRKKANGEGSLTKYKDGRWCGRCTVTRPDGKQRRIAVYGRTKEEARIKLTKKMAESDSGVVFDAENQTVEEYVTRWLEDSAKGNIAPRTYHNYRLQLNRHIIPALGKRKLDKLTPPQIQRLYRSKLDDGLSPSSVRYIHAVLHRALEQAVKWQLIPRNPADSVDPPKVRQQELQPLDAEQARKLLEAASGDRLECLYVVSLTIGLRAGEALGLKWSDIDLEEGKLRVSRQLQRMRDGGGLVFSEPKNASRRTVDLPERTVEALKLHRRRQAEERLIADSYGDQDLVFATTRGTPLDAQNVVNRSFKPLLKRAELPDIRFHDLWHTCATLLLGRGVHPKMVQHLLGHSTIAMTLDRYSHWVPSMGRQAADGMDAALS